MTVQYWATLSTDGAVQSAGATSAAAPSIPLGALAITAEQAATIAASPNQCSVINGVLILRPLPTPAPVSLEAFKASASLQVDQAAETARLRFLTPGSGQAMEYQQTLAEADQALSANPGQTLPPEAFPFLAAEQQALASVGLHRSLADVALDVRGQMEAWAPVGAAIKQIRRGAKLRIDAAASLAEVHAVLDGLAWPAPP